MNCTTCDYRGESPISGMCEGCVNCEKHSNKNKKATNLKPCPFCGSKAYQYEQNYYDRYVVECENCGVKITNATINSAIKDWNNRPVEESLQNIIESMKSCLNCEHNDVDTFFGDSCLHTDAKKDRNKFKRDCLAQNKKYWQLTKE